MEGNDSETNRAPKFGPFKGKGGHHQPIDSSGGKLLLTFHLEIFGSWQHHKMDLSNFPLHPQVFESCPLAAPEQARKSRSPRNCTFAARDDGVFLFRVNQLPRSRLTLAMAKHLSILNSVAHNSSLVHTNCLAISRCQPERVSHDVSRRSSIMTRHINLNVTPFFFNTTLKFIRAHRLYYAKDLVGSGSKWQ